MPAWLQAGVFAFACRNLGQGGFILFIKRLEIHGFKSFADRTTLELTPGITVVVGPNGCGKSNIADALRWVLGEQSVRLLRGARMEDIIFNGTASRKPLGFAEVSVTMDHSDGRLGLDYREVTFTRRLYRDGTSEYMLNRRVCRLKEILDMFMDTGIGKEAYSFIGQGRIDEILNSRPEERRLVFEEAAGIQKYRNRKREAERRLFETHENLLRVDDIIRELSVQLEPLQAQAGAARRYLGFREELRDTEVAMFVHEAVNLRHRIAETDVLCQRTADAALQRQTEIAVQESGLTAFQADLDEKQSGLMKIRQETQLCSSELEKYRGLMVLSQEKLRSQQQLATGISADIKALNSQYSALETDNRHEQKEMAEAERIIEKLSGELVDLENALSAAKKIPEAEQASLCQAELDNLLTEIRTLQSEHERLRLSREQFAAQMDRLQHEEAGKADQLSLLSGKTENLGAAQSALQQELEHTVSKRHSNRQEVEELMTRAEVFDRHIREGEKRQAEADGRLRLLQELESAHTGYGHGVKMILDAIKSDDPQLRGVLGTVADIIQVPAPYVAAVEAALGPALMNLVTEDDSVAKVAISWLKKVKGGRATFLPLNLLAEQQSHRPPVNCRHIEGYLGVASGLVEAPSRFRKVIDMLLSRVHIVRDLDIAVSVARLLRFRERVATLDGDVILPGGAMTGGRERKQGGILSRRRDIAELQQACAQEQERLLAVAAERASLSERLEAALQLSKTLDDLYLRQEHEILLYNREAELLREQSLVLIASLDALEREKHALSVQEGEISGVGLAVLARLDMLAGREREVRVALAQLEGKLAAREQERKLLHERHTECRVRLAAFTEKLEYFGTANERQARAKQELEKAIRLKEEELTKCQSAGEELRDALAVNEEAAFALERSLKQKISELAAREKEVRILADKLAIEREALRQAEKDFSAFERRQHRLEMEREKAEHELQSVLARLRHNWQLDLAEAETIAAPLTDYQAASERAAALKQLLQSAGTVNLGAIDELSRISERISFLTSQRADLAAAGRDLQKVISDVDALMAEKFAAAFKVLNESFGQVFKDLFGGGKSQLRLTDPQNPLESGVEIIAQPPGKRQQPLSLLSGGEKALSAIALLFSFLKVKPAPFCILDEIDTALDEANLARFNSYLSRLTSGTQFILISHRKKTMEQADMLYGATMEEAGVSRIISVRLSTPAHLGASAG